ncbi:hypothetical protein [Myroides marinus]|uniref:hypothetical protein n=1 Tax=Myroides marinus TaxID=703342 RepID=UPI002578DC2D|nr:hypothetical protein [Myroides marinus]MDM1376346.1 hypothetical protein [Myroides marinus]MDM1382060.1 hypothetical protein [Myroides marinus]
MKYIILSFVLFLSHLGIAKEPLNKLDNEEYKQMVNAIGVYCLRTSASENKKLSEAILPFKNQTLEEYKAENVDVIKGNSLFLYNELLSLRDEENSTYKTKEYLNGGSSDKNIINNENYASIVKYFSKDEKRVLDYKRDFDEIRQIVLKEFQLNSEEDNNDAKKDNLKNRDIEQIRENKLNNSQTKDIGLFEPKPLLVGLVLGSVLGFIVTFFLFKKIGFFSNVKEEFQYKDDRVVSFSVNESTTVLNNSNSDREEIKKLKDVLGQFKKEKEELEKRLADTEERLSQFILRDKVEDLYQTPVEEVVTLSSTHHIKYYSIPDQNGVFKSEKSKEHSIYTIENKKDHIGSFYIDIDEKYLKDAIFEINAFIDCGCEYSLPPNNSTKGIRVLQSGIVEREGNDWRIVEKCRIEFI